MRVLSLIAIIISVVALIVSISVLLAVAPASLANADEHSSAEVAALQMRVQSLEKQAVSLKTQTDQLSIPVSRLALDQRAEDENSVAHYNILSSQILNDGGDPHQAQEWASKTGDVTALQAYADIVHNFTIAVKPRGFGITPVIAFFCEFEERAKDRFGGSLSDYGEYTSFPDYIGSRTGDDHVATLLHAVAIHRWIEYRHEHPNMREDELPPRPDH